MFTFAHIDYDEMTSHSCVTTRLTLHSNHQPTRDYINVELFCGVVCCLDADIHVMTNTITDY